jgi:uncharacterized protein (DUF1330 family)
MTAYLFVAIKSHDRSWTEEYQLKVPAIVHKHSGELLAASTKLERLEGDGPDRDQAVLMAFPSMAAINAFVSDPDYRPYREARLAASSGEAFAFTTGG